MKRIIAALVAAGFVAATPVWAHDDDDDQGHGDKHYWKEQKHREKEWRKFQKHAWKHERRDVVVVQQAGPVIVERQVRYVEPRPVYYDPPAYYAPPAVVSAPAAINIRIPLR